MGAADVASNLFTTQSIVVKSGGVVLRVVVCGVVLVVSRVVLFLLCVCVYDLFLFLKNKNMVKVRFHPETKIAHIHRLVRHKKYNYFRPSKFGGERRVGAADVASNLFTTQDQGEGKVAPETKLPNLCE